MDQALGDVVKSLQVLDAGGERPEYWTACGPAADMTAADHVELRRLREVCSEFVQRHGEVYGASVGEERAALGRLCGEGVGYEAERGDVVPFDLSRVALPDTADSLCLEKVIPELGTWEEWMLPDVERRGLGDCPRMLHPGHQGR